MKRITHAWRWIPLALVTLLSLRITLKRLVTLTLNLGASSLSENYSQEAWVNALETSVKKEYGDRSLSNLLYYLGFHRQP